jgi:small subunit ribosomal protein S3
MGQKVNPVGFRLGINRGWDSVWYAKKKDFGNYLIEDFKIREYIKKNVVNSGVSKVMIERTSNKCYVTIYTSRPGFVIGKKGSDIDKIKNNLSKFTTNEVALNIKEVKKPETNAYLVAENIAQQLVKRISYRRAMKRSMQSCIRLGARGIKVSISGRLGGNEIARTEWLREGSIPSHTLRADIDYAEAEALTTYGIIGIKVWIYKGEVFQDDKVASPVTKDIVGDTSIDDNKPAKKAAKPAAKKTTVKAATKKTTVKAATKKTEAKEEPVVTDKADTTESSNEESSKDNNEA